MEKDRKHIDEKIRQIRFKLRDRRVVGVGGEINQESMAALTADIIMLGLESDDPIRLLMNSEGGDLMAAFGFADMVRNIKAPITCVVVGLCASAATIVL